ncbi:MAG TPA: FIST N-terminal domain-containing protein [Pirellulales bacterium]|nr:FIST N-terminal domain-containing protein [Pirellulales bacterium]
MLRFASALSDMSATAEAVDEVCSVAAAQLDARADLAVCFASHHHGPDFAPLLAAIDERLRPKTLIGCTGEAIVGTGREIEEQPALSLWLARLPGVNVRPMHLEFERTADGGTFTGWPEDLPSTWPAGSALIMLADPFTFPADALLERLDEAQPGIPVLGGMASGAAAPGENRIFLGGDAFDSGAVAILVDGDITVRSIVSQGCRPIGHPMVVTRAEQNVIFELGGRPAMTQLQELFDTLDPRDQQLVQRGLNVGLVINEYQDRFARGDFLVRNCVGADRKTGAIAVGDFVRTGQTVQFHVRDAASADEDLRELLGAVDPPADKHALGSLLFTCNGRGTRMFPEADHDARCLERRLGKIPTAGFFAQGEIGPVGGRNFLHGFTASIALFSARDTPSDR